MKLAYNQTLDIMIRAADYKGGVFDDFKLCCPYCGERVEYIPDLGGGRLPYFRHRHASYRDDCELYASSESIYFTGRRAGLKSQGDNASLYFQDNGHSIGFSIGITLSEERFTKCLARNEVLSIKVGEKDKKIPIDEGHFIPKRETLIPIDNDGETIIVAFGKLQERVDFLPKNKTAIFQVRDKAGFNEGGLLAKRVEKGAKVYYGEKYVFIYPQKLYIGEFIKKSNEKLIFGKYKVVYGEFKENSGAADEFCKNNDYRLSQAREKLTVLWPPIRRENEDNLVDGKTIYVATNFELEKDLTTNAMASKEDSYWSVRMGSNIKIAAGCIFEQFYPITNKILDFEELTINRIEASKIKAQENTYLFSSYGVELLEEGTWHVLSDVRYVKRYLQNYCIEVVEDLDMYMEYKDWITPVLQYNRDNESFLASEIQYKGSNPYVWDYLRGCRKNKTINRIIKVQLNEGRND